MAKKYTEEQLSRILSEHAIGGLQRQGCHNWKYFPNKQPRGCINQVAYNEASEGNDTFQKNRLAANWFDSNYSTKYSAEFFLQQLESLPDQD